MEEQKKERELNPIPYYVHEEIMARMERQSKRLFILCIIIFSALIITNAAWLVYENQFEEEVITQEILQDSGIGGTNNYNGKIVGGDDYGEAEDQNYGAQEDEEK